MPKTENFAGKKDLFGGFYANGSLTLDGNFTVYGREFSVLAENDVNIASGSLTVSGAGSAGVMSKAGKIIIPDGVKIDAASTSYPLYAKGYDSGLSEKITYPENYPGICAENDSGYQYFIDKEDNIIKHIIIQLGAEKYRVWVGGKQVTSENCSDIFGDSKASYNDADKVLTLNNPTISGAAELNKGSAKIVAEDYLNIVGSYHMSADDKADFGIFSFDSVKLDGDFTFITAKNAIRRISFTAMVLLHFHWFH